MSNTLHLEFQLRLSIYPITAFYQHSYIKLIGISAQIASTRPSLQYKLVFRDKNGIIKPCVTLHVSNRIVRKNKEISEKEAHKYLFCLPFNKLRINY